MQPVDKRVGPAILTLISNRPRSLRRHGSIGTLVRLLRDYQMALRAESMRSVRRADFFWREALRRLEVAWPDEALWSDLLQQEALKNVVHDERDGNWLREVIARELFADSLWALHNALESGDDSDKQRASALIDYLRTLIDRTGALDPARMTALGAALDDAVNRCAEAKQWERAKTLASWLLDQFGGEQHERLLAAMIAGHAIAGLADSPDESESRANAARLAEAVQRIEALRTRAPRNATLFDFLAELQLRMAIQLANGGRLSDGLVAVQKSVTYDPALQPARDVRVKLTELMTQLRHEAEMLRARVASTPNAALTGKGQEMVREAERGFAPFNAFVESAAAREISEKLMVAQGAAAWQSIGLPLEHPSDEQLNGLYRALNTTFQHAEGDPTRVPAAWRQTIGEVPAAAELDADRIVPWVQGRVAGVSKEPAPAAPIEWPDTTTISITRAARYRDHEPFTSWLFSPQAIWPKVACAAAVLALCASVVMYARDSQNRRDRDAAFDALRAARAAGEYAHVLDAAETFLSHSLSVPDPREAEVKSAYSEALVRWFIEQTPGSEADRRAARYRALVLAGTPGGSGQ
jgi:hypothetical protein